MLDDGTAQAALVAWESLFVPDAIWEETSRRIAVEAGIPPERLLLSAVHDHGAPTLPGSQATPPQRAYITTVENAAVQAVQSAKARLQAARFGMSTAKAYVNVNRREFSPGRGWWLGFNDDDGPSDKTVTVLRFEDLTGKPIAFWINYPVHAVVMGPENLQITGDLAGATSRFVEQHYMGKDRPRSDGGSLLRLRPEETTAATFTVSNLGHFGIDGLVAIINPPQTAVLGVGAVRDRAVVRQGQVVARPMMTVVLSADHRATDGADDPVRGADGAFCDARSSADRVERMATGAAARHGMSAVVAAQFFPWFGLLAPPMAGACGSWCAIVSFPCWARRLPSF